nr:hypothetical protein [Tanacetum cinerariifolium]
MKRSEKLIHVLMRWRSRRLSGPNIRINKAATTSIILWLQDVKSGSESVELLLLQELGRNASCHFSNGGDQKNIMMMNQVADILNMQNKLLQFTMEAFKMNLSKCI